jgi:hypothetical protein
VADLVRSRDAFVLPAVLNQGLGTVVGLRRPDHEEGQPASEPDSRQRRDWRQRNVDHGLVTVGVLDPET